MLDKEGTQYREAVRFLRTMVEKPYTGVLAWDMWHGVAQDLHALLVGHCELGAEVSLAPLTAGTKASSRTWWSKLLLVLRRLDQEVPGIEQTNLWEDPRDLQWPSPTQSPAEENMTSDDRRWHQEAEDQEAREAQEEHDLQMLVQQREEGQKAADYRAWEERVMQEEMSSRRSKRPRLRLTLSMPRIRHQAHHHRGLPVLLSRHLLLEKVYAFRCTWSRSWLK